MKKLLFATALIFGFSGAFAQKQGYISVSDVVSIMPETAAAESTLTQYQQEVSGQINQALTQLKAMDSTFNTDSSTYSPSLKEIKRKEMVKIYQQYSGLQQGASGRLQDKQSELLAPIQAKAVAAIKAVATENKYSYVLDAQSLIIAPPGDDLLPLVKAKLGIKDAPVAPAAKPTGKQ